MLGLVAGITTICTVAVFLLLHRMDDNFRGNKKVTRPLLSFCDLTCPPGKDLRQNTSHRSVPNGCGSSGFNFDDLVQSGHVDCCYHHDFCYGTCNNKKELCDDNFKECLKGSCNSTSKIKKEKCMKEAETLFTAVQGGGCIFYQKAQYDACVCG